jgi:hypothetical protein
MRNLHLIIAGLYPDPAPTALPEALRLLLARGRRRSGEFQLSPAQRLARFSAPGQGDIAMAPWRMAHDGLSPTGAGWYCADPVHLRLMRDHVLLGDAHAFELDAAEAASLVAGLNEHFCGRIEFVAAVPERWYARFSAPLAVPQAPLDARLARPVETRSSATGATRELARLSNEVQMFLHQHPVNAEREARGVDPINGVWFWGEGTQAPPALPVDLMFGESPLAAAIAAAAGKTFAPLESLAGRLTLPQDSALAFIDRLHAPACYGQAPLWQRRLDELEAVVFQPVFAELRRGRLETLDIETLGPAGCGLRLTRRDVWKIWRR